MAENQAVKKERIGTAESVTLIFFALICDVISLIPVANDVIAIVAPIIFGIAFYLMGVGILSPKKALTAAIGLVVEVVPVISMLPAYTLGVVLIIHLTHAEDKTGIKLTGKVSGKGALKKSIKGAKGAFDESSKIDKKSLSRGDGKISATKETKPSPSRAVEIVDEEVDETQKTKTSDMVEDIYGKNDFDFDAEKALLDREKNKQRVSERVDFDNLLKTAEAYDRKAVELRIAGRTEEASEYTEAAGNLRRQYAKKASDEELGIKRAA